MQAVSAPAQRPAIERGEGAAPLLRIALEAAVPLWIAQIRSEAWPFAEIQRVAKEAAQVVAAKGDVILFKSAKRGETAAAFNALARGIACLAFVPGGVKCFGLCFQAQLPEISSVTSTPNDKETSP